MAIPAGVLASFDADVLGRTLLGAADAAGVGVTVAVFEDGKPRNVFVSEAAANISGWSVQEMLESDPLAHVCPEYLPQLYERLGRRVDGEKGQVSYRVEVHRKDGSRAAIEVAASHTSIAGRPAVFAFIFDASRSAAAEKDRLRNEARFRELIESAPEPIGIIREGRFVYANRAYLDVLGYSSPAALYEVPIAQLLDADESAQRDLRESLIVKARSPQPARTYRARRADGSIVVVEVTSAYFEYEGKPSVLNLARNVTERKRLETQLVQSDRLAALGTMAAGVAHEINNPLAYVMLNLEWIARKLPSVADDPGSLQGLMEMLQEARHGAERVSMIVRELRSFSRVEGETRREVDLARVVQSAIRIAGHEVRHRARVVTSFEPARPVWANEARLEQVVINLLLNAAQAMSERRAETNEIRVAVREAEDDRVVLEIADNGEGIPSEVLPRIFDPFFTTKPVGVGTGLGLSICHGIVSSLGGQITAYSAPGEGTTFRVVLPTTEPLRVEGSEPVSEGPVSRSGRRARVLVVDDELPIANTLRELLSPEHDVVAATSAREALAALEQTPEFDVIFCDLMMPGMNGIDLYDRVRADRPGLERRIVFMTGGAFTARTAEFLAQVENRRVEKPFSLGLIERIVREMARSPAAAAHGAR